MVGKRYGLTLVSLLVAAPVAAQNPKPFSCEVKSVITRDKQTVSVATKVYYGGPAKVRLEQSTGKTNGVMIVNGSDAWIIDGIKKQGQHKKLSPAEQAPLAQQARNPGDVVNDFIKGGGKKAGQESIDGVRCDVYKKAGKNGVTSTIWVLPGPQKLARRVLVAGTINAAPGPGQPMKQMVFRQQQDYSNWQIGKPIAAVLFRPAPGIKITEFTPPPGGMPGGMPGAPGIPPGRR
jgi:hypothetical protein